ncbi:MAG: acetylornithine deacetylase [Alphaproteobacteria bacterium]|nr:acetylornithine deacetylase [Alphaproteobacteria bacterium]MBV8548487.1 acetylornithine deacetylase [Alphaproteobacteria bacterium]
MSDPIYDKAIDLLRQLVAFDTTSRNPNRPCIDFIRDYLQSCGVESEILPGDEEGKACLFATIGHGTKGGVMLAGHSDVVPVDGQNWLTDPFTLTEKDDKFYARGACDMKGFIACILALVPRFVAAADRLPQPIHLAFTYDEEVTMEGAARLSAVLAERGIAPAWSWVGEPTGLEIVDSHKGVAGYKTYITGVEAHSGKPDLGLNAIELGHDFMTILRDVAQKKRDNPYVPSRFDPPYTTLNLAQIVAGQPAENIIAPGFELLWQTRAHPGDNSDQIVADIDARALACMADRFKAFAPQAGLRTCTCFNIPPLMPTADNPGRDRIAAVTGRPETIAVSFGTEAGFYQKLGGAVVICGPGDIDVAHKANEFVDKSQLNSCIDLLTKVLLSSGTAVPA